MGHPEVIVEALRSKRRIGIDTPVLIYHIEQTSPRASAATAILRAEVADAYQALLGDITNLTIVSLDARVARIGAELRATYGLRTPDALQIAACLAHGAEAFITNDRRLRRVTEVEVNVLEDFA